MLGWAAWQARGTCDAKVLEYGTGTFTKLRALVVAVLGPQNAAAPADPTTVFLGRIDAAERFLKHEFKSHVMQVPVLSCLWYLFVHVMCVFVLWVRVCMCMYASSFVRSYVCDAMCTNVCLSLGRPCLSDPDTGGTPDPWTSVLHPRPGSCSVWRASSSSTCTAWPSQGPQASQEVDHQVAGGHGWCGVGDEL